MITADVLIKSLEYHGVEYIFGYPGASILPILDALIDSKIKFILTRHEQAATHAADGYARATGKVGVVLVTSGPGVANTVCGIMTAKMDSVPLVILCGQTAIANLGTDAFQETDALGLTIAVCKHSYQLKQPDDIGWILDEALHIATTGRPGPVLLDLPNDLLTATSHAKIKNSLKLPGYNLKYTHTKKQLEVLAKLINHATKPLLLIGQGAKIANAATEVKQLAHKINAPVINTLLGKGVFSEYDDLSLGLVGMFGTEYANKAVAQCDVLIAIGCRFSNRITMQMENFAQQAQVIQIDIDPTEIDKNIQTAAHVIGDAKEVLTELLPMIQSVSHPAWLNEIGSYVSKCALHFDKRGALKVPLIITELNHLTQGRITMVSDVGQHQMWAAQFYRALKGSSWLTSGGAGTMGYALPAAIGAQLGRPDEKVAAIIGDGGFQMTMAELATAATYKLPIKIFVMENCYLGLVRQAQEFREKNRLFAVLLKNNPVFHKLAKTYRIKSFYLDRHSDLRKIIKKALAYNKGPCLIHAKVACENDVASTLFKHRILSKIKLPRRRK
ncbi:MAG: biosynthetic-type acetolactate synthase large subunit [Gammaproteobacteria bacterium]|nr:biosynthetic-type acetolactate synthase large subunit [Gammaproteobacteria bacterium]